MRVNLYRDTSSCPFVELRGRGREPRDDNPYIDLTYDGLDMNYLFIGSAAPKFCLLEA